MNLTEFEESLDSPSNSYWVSADQEYLVEQVRRLLEARVDESARAFDWAVIDLSREQASETDPALELVDLARTNPWMTDFRWIFVANADLGGERLADYLKKPSRRTVMVLASRKQGRDWPPIEAVELLQSVRQWLQGRITEEGFQVEPGAIDLLLEMVGEDLRKLDAEIEKQILYQTEDRSITVESVLAMTFAARQRDVFEIISALADRDTAAALNLLRRLFEGGASPQNILGILYWNFKRLLVAREELSRGRSFFSLVKTLKIWSFKNQEQRVREFSVSFLEEILLRVRTTDQMLKSTTLDPRMQLERLIVDTCQRRSV